VAVILLVEDDPLIAEFTLKNLAMHGFEARLVRSGQEALDTLRLGQEPPDLILLDLRLPDMDGFDLCRRIRQSHPADGLHLSPQTPIIMLTARVKDVDKLRGFGLGADDYVTKPFNPLELIARIQAVLRRAGAQTRPRLLVWGRLTINPEERIALLDDSPLTLTPLEFDLLLFFARNPDRVLKRQELLEAVWGHTFVTPRTVDEHVKRLRQKLGLPKGGGIDTVHAVGYRWHWPEEPAEG